MKTTLTIKDQLHAEVELDLLPSTPDSVVIDLAEKLVQYTDAIRVRVLRDGSEPIYERTRPSDLMR